MSILVERLTYTYAVGSPLARTALREVSLEIPSGACVAVVGVTGSGKSTLVQHFNGLLTPTSGRVEVDGLTLGPRGVSSAKLVELRRSVGLLFQFPEAQLFAASIFEDVAFGPRRLGLDEAQVRSRVRWALEAVALPAEEAFLARSPFDLSGGQRRRIALAGVLAMRPRTLILDEPTAGLDAEAREELYGQFATLQQREGLTLILVSHDMAEVAALAEQVFVLAEGELRLWGPPAEVFLRAEEIAACGLLPPPLAQVATLAAARGFPHPSAASLTPETLATVLSDALAPRPTS